MKTIFNLNIRVFLCEFIYVMIPFSIKLWISSLRSLFLTKFQVETTVMVRCVKITRHCFTDIFPFWLSDRILSADISQAILFQPSPMLALMLMLSVWSTFATVQPPAYLEKFTSLSFLILGNIMETQYPNAHKTENSTEVRLTLRINVYK